MLHSHRLVFRQSKYKTCSTCLPTQNSPVGECDSCSREVSKCFHLECQSVLVDFFFWTPGEHSQRMTFSPRTLRVYVSVFVRGGVGVEGRRSIHMFFISRQVFVLQSWGWPLLCATSSLPQPIQSPLNQTGIWTALSFLHMQRDLIAVMQTKRWCHYSLIMTLPIALAFIFLSDNVQTAGWGYNGDSRYSANKHKVLVVFNQQEKSVVYS